MAWLTRCSETLDPHFPRARLPLSLRTPLGWLEPRWGHATIGSGESSCCVATGGTTRAKWRRGGDKSTTSTRCRRCDAAPPGWVGRGTGQVRAWLSSASAGRRGAAWRGGARTAWRLLLPWPLSANGSLDSGRGTPDSPWVRLSIHHQTQTRCKDDKVQFHDIERNLEKKGALTTFHI